MLYGLRNAAVMAAAGFLIGGSALAQAQSPGSAFVPEINAAVDAEAERLKDIYKDIHEHAELGFMEHRTAGIVAEELAALGFEVKTGIGVTGVVGILRNGEGPTFAFRADMDANAVEEATGLPYASKVRVTNLDGVETAVAHMCGHDAHTTWLIGLAKTMAALKDEWSGTLVLIAQPAEEPIEGAKAMVEDGIFTTQGVPEPDHFLVFHTAPLPTGTVALTGGRFNTGSDHIDIVFHGSGGHGSSPHHASDPVMMAGMAIVQLQTVISRMIDPVELGVLTIGSVQAGVDNNVIPVQSMLKLKLHYSTAEVRKSMVAGIERVANNIARTYGVTSDEMMPEFIYKGYAPAVVNTEAYIESIRSVLVEAKAVDEVVNEARAIEGVAINELQIPGSDDALALIEGIEGVQVAYLGIGTAEPELVEEARAAGHEFPFFVHEPNYRVDLEAIPWGATLASVLALDVLAK